MSFSSKVKEELLGHIGNSRHCRLAELAAILTMSGLNAETQVTGKANRLISMLNIDVNSEEGHLALKLKDCGQGYIADRILIERSCCKQAYLRGAFLASGSMTNPEKAYHFEIVCNDAPHAELIAYIMSDFGLEPGTVRRKKYYVVYLKDGSMIVDILNVMGAHKSLMGMENVRILKDMRNSVNRRVNCETANINKTVSAAVKQIEDIRFIEQTKGLKYLPDNLRILAELRLEEPEMPLKELGERLVPPLGKSGVNHRLRKISEIAGELRRS
ncbi:MAG: DNA-binding protein WhiA [Wujia sp.]